MAERKIGEVEASIIRLREQRYMTRGAGAKQPPKPSLTSLRAEVAKVTAKPKKPKGRKGSHANKKPSKKINHH